MAATAPERKRPLRDVLKSNMASAKWDFPRSHANHDRRVCAWVSNSKSGLDTLAVSNENFILDPAAGFVGSLCRLVRPCGSKLHFGLLAGGRKPLCSMQESSTRAWSPRTRDYIQIGKWIDWLGFNWAKDGIELTESNNLVVIVRGQNNRWFVAQDPLADKSCCQDDVGWLLVELSIGIKEWRDDF